MATSPFPPPPQDSNLTPRRGPLATSLEVLAAVSLLLSLGYLGYHYVLAGSQYLRVFFR